MPTNRETLLCRYHYDPLDRLAACTPSAQASTQHFYLKTRLATEIQGSVQRSIFQQEDQLLAQQQRQGGTVETTLLATDQQRSVLYALDATRTHPLAYSPYGHRAPENGLLSLLGFNGERPDPVTGHYLLGNGYRAFNLVLMRFNSPDSWSPFGEGGLNGYAYCGGDSVNRRDPTGHSFWSKMLGFLSNLFPRAKSKHTFELLEVSRPTQPFNKIRRLSTPTPKAQDAIYEMAGHHGSTDKHSKKLMQGIDPELGIGKKQLGKGFYATIDPNLAKGYAKLRALESGAVPEVYSVYVKNYSGMIPERDYSTSIHRGINGGYTTQTIFMPHVADMISIRETLNN